MEPSGSAREQRGPALPPHLGDGDAVAVPGDGGFQRGLAEAVQVAWLALLQLAVLGHLHPLGYRWARKRGRSAPRNQPGDVPTPNALPAFPY